MIEQQEAEVFYVYFIQPNVKGNQPVKIGYSRQPYDRLKKLQTSNWLKLKISLMLPFESEVLAREAERTFHHLAGKKHKILERCYGFNVIVGAYEYGTEYGQKALKAV